MNLDIVLLPPEKVSEKIGVFVRALSKKVRLKMKVDNRKLFPHVSLFHVNSSFRHLAAIKLQLEKISSRYKAQKLSFTKPNIGSDYFVMDLKKNRKLNNLHRSVVIKTCKFAEGVAFKHMPKDKQGLKYVKKYGAANILKNFQPHITLGIISSKNNLEIIRTKLLKKHWTDFTTNRLALTQVNSRHQVTKILKEFKLR